ncbi:hypothetical protein YC2023_032064 [Brassica napus]
MMMMKKSGDVAGDGILPLATGDRCLQDYRGWTYMFVCTFNLNTIYLIFAPALYHFLLAIYNVCKEKNKRK